MPANHSKQYLWSVWGVLWRSKNSLDGTTEHIMCDGGLPKLFRTRKQARQWIDAEYGYIMRRPDLRAKQHGWRLPLAVRVVVLAAAAVRRAAK